MFVTVVVTAGLLWPGTGDVLSGLFIPRIPDAGGEGLTWTVALWDAASGRQLAKGRLDAPSNGIQFSPDGSLIVEASAMGTANVIDTTTLRRNSGLAWGSLEAEEIARGIPGIVAPLLSAAVSHDGDRIAFAPNDNTIRVWFAGRDLDRLLHHVARQLPRCLTVEQERRYFLRTEDDPRPPEDCRKGREAPAVAGG
jgi:WD40 repeat protein